MIQQGDRVVCVEDDNSYGQLIVGRQYIVYAVDTCCEMYLDVGLKSEATFCECELCGSKSSDGILWCHYMMFRKVEERTIEYTAEIKIDIPEPVLS